VTACRRVLGVLDAFVVFFGSGGNNDNPMFLGLSGTGLSDMVKSGKVFRILPRTINYQQYQVRTWAVVFEPRGQESSYTFSSLSSVIPVR
jgi:hypothetical protein